jgi:hypothetical protein
MMGKSISLFVIIKGRDRKEATPVPTQGGEP